MSAIFPSPCTIAAVWTQTLLFWAEFWGHRVPTGRVQCMQVCVSPEHLESSFCEQY